MRFAAALFAALAVTLAASGSPAAPRPKSKTPKPKAVASAPRPREQSDRALEDSLRAIARNAPGQLRVEARLLSGNRVARLAADTPSPMASTYKLPIAVAVLSEVDAGRLALAQPIRLLPQDMNPGVSALGERYPEGGVDVTVGELLSGMLATSDNTACDVLLRVLGGGGAVTSRMRALGVAPMRIDRTEMRIGDEASGFEFPWPDSLRTRATVRAARRSSKPEEQRAGLQRFLDDPRDTATPAAMNQLLERIWRREALAPATTDTLLAMMAQCRTGSRRLRAGLPERVAVYDRTGTGPSFEGRTACVNAVALVRLPGSGGWVAISVFQTDVRGEVAVAEDTLARVARAVFEVWNAPD